MFGDCTGLLVHSESREEYMLVRDWQLLCKSTSTIAITIVIYWFAPSTVLHRLTIDLKIWSDKQRFKFCADGKPGAPSDDVADAFSNVSEKCTPNSYRKMQYGRGNY